jgi:hypothetical protein
VEPVIDAESRAIREAFVTAAIAACEDARMRGLCWEGAFECAIEAMRAVDVRALTLQGSIPPEPR